MTDATDEIELVPGKNCGAKLSPDVTVGVLVATLPMIGSAPVLTTSCNDDDAAFKETFDRVVWLPISDVIKTPIAESTIGDAVWLLLWSECSVAHVTALAMDAGAIADATDEAVSSNEDTLAAEDALSVALEEVVLVLMLL